MRITVGILEQQGKHTSPVYPTTDIISRWSFDDDNGDDTSGNGYDIDACLGIPTYAAGKVNDCLVLDNSTNMVNTSYYDDVSTLTMAFWYKCNTQTENGGVIMVAETSIGAAKWYGLLTTTDTLEVGLDPYQSWYPGPSITVDNAWHFIIAQCDSGTYEIWEDNVSLGTSTPGIFPQPVFPGEIVRVGGYTAITPQQWGFNGSLDNMYVYDRILTSAERDALWNNGNGI